MVSKSEANTKRHYEPASNEQYAINEDISKALLKRKLKKKKKRILRDQISKSVDKSASKHMQLIKHIIFKGDRPITSQTKEQSISYINSRNDNYSSPHKPKKSNRRYSSQVNRLIDDESITAQIGID